MCAGAATTLSNTTSGGTWTSDNTLVATVSVAGVVSGVDSGTAVVSYSLDGGCVATAVVTVNAAPAAITGVLDACTGSVVTLTSATSGGVWSVGTSSAASIGAGTGVVTAIAPGTTTVTYSVAGCATTAQFTVNPLLNAGSITGATIVEVGSSITLTAGTSSGTWSTSDPTASITAGGVVTGLAAGSATITYTVSNSCGTSVGITIISIVIPGSETCSLWGTLGTTGFSAGQASYISMTRNSSGVLYAVYSDGANGNKATVVRYNGTTWATVGTVGISAGAVYYTSITTDVSGQPYIAYMDYANGNKATVQKFNGSSWVTVGTAGFSAGQASFTSIVINSGTPYVAYSDAANSSKSTVMKFNGTAWVVVGAPGFSSGIASNVSLAIDNGGTPYVAYQDGANGNKATVKKFNGTSWATVGSEGLSAGSVSNTSLALDNNGTPVLAYSDVANGGKATVVKYLTSGWASLGSAGFSAGQANYVTLTLGSSGVPYVAYRDEANGSKATVMKFNGAVWQPFSSAGFTTGAVSYVAIAADASDMPVIMFQDGAASYKATAKKFNSGVANITGTGSLCAGSTVTLTDATTGGTWTSNNLSIATVDASSGIVSGLAAGASVITYTAGPCTTTFVVTVSIPASAGTISGPASVVAGGVVTLSTTGSGGTWSASNGNASVSASGIVTGVTAGASVIAYSVLNACGTAIATHNITINPALDSITGISSVCSGSSITLSASAVGGAWTSNNSVIATVDATTGVVTGGSPGIATITYTMPGGFITGQVTVNTLPNLISGAASICQGATLTVADVTTGGTWSSGSTSVASISASGVVTGLSAGTSVISYTLSTGCARTAVVTVSTSGGVITGPSSLCVGTTITLGNTGSGGSWSSSNNTAASISAAGVVAGLAAGNATITYSLGTCRSTALITVITQPANITGTTKACPGTSTTLGDATGGGIWSSGNVSIATVDAASGVVNGVAAGTAVISYAAGAGCVKTTTVTINAAPAAITGTMTVCVGAVTTLSDATTGALSWTSSNTAVATANTVGAVTGVSAGTATITYNLGTGCYTTTQVTVNPAPDVTGPSSVCLGSTVTLSSSTAGGTWTSSATAAATVDIASGIVTGVSATSGYPRITYTLPTGCYKVTGIVTVNPLPNDFTGTRTVCVGTTTTLTSNYGGTWSSPDASIVTMPSSTSGYVQGASAGTATISYVVVSTGCLRTGVVTVSPMPTAIAGTLSVCSGATATLSNSISGGTWSSSAPTAATIGSTDGVVSAVGTQGTMTITYAISSNCRVTAAFTVKAMPGVIGGTTNVCAGYTTTLSTSVSGGVWSSASTSIATVGNGLSSAYGAVAGVAAGTTVISYTSSNGCYRTAVVTVNACPRPADPNTQMLAVDCKLYPNPTTGQFTFESPVGGQMAVYSLDGKEVFSYNVNQDRTALELPSGIAAGVYLCRFHGTDGSSVIIRLVYDH